ncbi:glycoside hydrolase family 15 protein [Sporobolomyces koalae]|uniref:glycoside hydrolase family 15 protein n=1 Tax=Sporobolomyces koalae TaxID=500713 RepID=UPI003181FCA6
MSTLWQRISYFLKAGPPAPGTAARRRSASTSLNSAPATGSSPARKNPLTDLAFEEFLDKQLEASWTKLLANVHPAGTTPGAIVASPSKAKPDYWYQWTRDSAVVMRNIVKRYVANPNADDERLIREYIEASLIMQHKTTVMGGFETGGLGEVKYYVDEHHADPKKQGNEPFMGEWGRPQDDGPGSRIITLSIYALWCLEHGSPEQAEYARTKLYPGTGAGTATGVIKGDLDYVARHWKTPGFDREFVSLRKIEFGQKLMFAIPCLAVWEEVSGLHFYTLLTLRTSLIDGAKLATALDDSASAAKYTAVASELTPSINRFWSPAKNIVRVTLDHTAGRESTENAHVGDAEYGKKSELDAAVLLAVLHAGRESTWATLTPGAEDEESATKILATLRALMDDMGALYPLNKGRRQKKQGVALGRYPEDEYDGVGLSIAHPWYLCTSAAAEFLYLLISHLAQPSDSTGGIVMTPLLHSTLESILPKLSHELPKINAHLSTSSEAFVPLVSALFDLADSFLAVVQEYVGEAHRLDEQFERAGSPRGGEKHDDGEVEDGKKDGDTIGRGARELTWSHAALITAVQQRRIAKEALDQLAKR